MSPKKRNTDRRTSLLLHYKCHMPFEEYAWSASTHISFVTWDVLDPVVGEHGLHITKRQIDAKSANVQPGVLPPVPQDNEVFGDPQEFLRPERDRTSLSGPAASLCLWKRKSHLVRANHPQKHCAMCARVSSTS